MKRLPMTALVLILSPMFASQGSASCSLANEAKPSMRFTSATKPARMLKFDKAPSKLTRGLIKARPDKQSDTADQGPWDIADAVCDDWLAICSNDDCTHGVVDCDGQCIDF